MGKWTNTKTRSVHGRFTCITVNSIRRKTARTFIQQKYANSLTNTGDIYFNFFRITTTFSQTTIRSIKMKIRHCFKMSNKIRQTWLTTWQFVSTTNRKRDKRHLSVYQRLLFKAVCPPVQQFFWKILLQIMMTTYSQKFCLSLCLFFWSAVFPELFSIW